MHYLWQTVQCTFFPNIHEILKLLFTVPVEAVPYEGAFSAMRRLKEWDHSTMREERLCGLAFLFTHRDVEVSRDNVLRQFDSSGHRRIGSLF